MPVPLRVPRSTTGSPFRTLETSSGWFVKSFVRYAPLPVASYHFVTEFPEVTSVDSSAASMCTQGAGGTEELESDMDSTRTSPASTRTSPDGRLPTTSVPPPVFVKPPAPDTSPTTKSSPAATATSSPQAASVPACAFAFVS